jgi:hypothetical protein
MLHLLVCSRAFWSVKPRRGSARVAKPPPTRAGLRRCQVQAAPLAQRARPKSSRQPEKGGSAPKGGAHSTVCFACTASETLENIFYTDNLLMVWQSIPKVVPRSRISRSATPFLDSPVLSTPILPLPMPRKACAETRPCCSRIPVSSHSHALCRTTNTIFTEQAYLANTLLPRWSDTCAILATYT